MKLALLLLVLVFSLCAAGCVTTADLYEVQASVGKLEEVIEDRCATTEEMKGAVLTARAEISAVAKKVDERTEGFVDSLTDPDGGGVAALISLATAMGLNYYRDRRREQRGEPVKTTPRRRDTGPPP